MGLYLGWAEQDSWGRGYRERMGSMSLKGLLDLDAHFLLYRQVLPPSLALVAVAWESGCLQPLPSMAAGPVDRPSLREQEGPREAEVLSWRPQVWEGRSAGSETV